MSKPEVILNCVANQYAAPQERIIEFSHPNGGGLISFFATDDGRLHVDLYHVDATVDAGGKFGNKPVRKSKALRCRDKTKSLVR
jgi:hypothetical protein